MTVDDTVERILTASNADSFNQFPTGVRGLDEVLGRRLWDEVQDRLAKSTRARPAEGTLFSSKSSEPAARFGEPTLVHPRLGQGSFRVLVTDAYERRCAVTLERTLPALEAAHIRPYAEGGSHDISNGLFLRADIHRLFDQGFVTVTPDYQFRVSRRLQDEYENGRIYYDLEERIRRSGGIHIPKDPANRPEPELLRWHSSDRFVA